MAVLHPERTILSVKRELAGARQFRIGDRDYGPEDRRARDPQPFPV